MRKRLGEHLKASSCLLSEFEQVSPCTWVPSAGTRKGQRASEQPHKQVIRLAHFLITPLQAPKDSRSPTHATTECSAEGSKVFSSSLSWPLPCCKDRFREFFFTVWLGIKSSSTVQQEIEKSLVVMTVDQL